MNLFFDLETIPDQTEGALQEFMDNIKPPGQYKKPESIQKWIETQGAETAFEQWKQTALEGIAGEIVSIAWTFDDEPVDGLLVPGHEAATIQGFFDAVYDRHQSGEGKFQQITWIGHNIIDFDLRFLYQRACVLGIKPSFLIPNRPGSTIFDTMKEWAGFRGYVKQESLYKALGGQPYENDDVDGSMVWDMIQAGCYDEVLAYNKRDVEKVRHNYKALTWQ